MSEFESKSEEDIKFEKLLTDEENASKERESIKYEKLGEEIISPDGKHAARVEMWSNGQVLVVDELKVSEEYDEITNIAWDEASQQFTYDGKRGPDFDLRKVSREAKRFVDEHPEMK